MRGYWLRLTMAAAVTTLVRNPFIELLHRLLHTGSPFKVLLEVGSFTLETLDIGSNMAQWLVLCIN